MGVSPKADLVLRNGVVFKGLNDGVAEAVAVWKDQVLATGTTCELEPLVGPETRVLDLRGRFAAPGLCDAHLHLLPLGLTLAELDVRPCRVRTLDELLGVIRNRVREVSPGEWILGRGYDQFQLDVTRHPLRDELDQVAPENPVHLVRVCGHISIANSMALRLAGVSEATPVPVGGVIEQHNDRLTGLLAETARDAIKAVLPDPTDEDLVAAIEQAGQYGATFGITSAMDAAVGMRCGYREIAAYRKARHQGRLPLRTSLCLMGGPGGIVDHAYADGLMTGAGDELLTIGPVKLFADGSVGGRTAAMSSPYLGAPRTTGVFSFREDELRSMVQDYHARGYQLAIHAIGDAAIDQVLAAYQAALTHKPDLNRRHRIEHCAFSRLDQITRMARLGIEPVTQPVFLHAFGDLYIAALGEERSATAIPMRAWVDQGLKPAASSDAPVCDPNPFPSLYAMTTRKTSRGTTLGAHEVLSREEALAAHTEFGAFVNKAEHHRGRLLPGLAADLAVFSKDLRTVEPDGLLTEVSCDLTIRGGQIIYATQDDPGTKEQTW
jgi:predicted amidohydrolase YtcJ